MSDICLSNHVPALNGVRGVAVVLVFLFHAGVPGFTGAFIGVDIFFVLSGFLITALLLQEEERRGTVSLKNFYLRRALRLLPALFLLLAVYLVYYFYAAPDAAERRRHFEDALMVLFYVSNWTRAFGWERPYSLGHCWSLSVEEQFYAVWPLVFLGLMRLRGNLRAPLIAVLFLGSWGWRVWLLEGGAGWDRVYNGFDTRADMLLAGCLLAFLVHDGRLSFWSTRRRAACLSSAAAVAVLAFLAAHGRWQTAPLYKWQYTVLALAAAVVILDVVARPEGLLSRFLSLPPLVWLGGISYGIYLWHYPLLHYVGSLGWRGWRATALTAALNLGLAVGSFYLVERRALRLKRRYQAWAPACPSPPVSLNRKKSRYISAEESRYLLTTPFRKAIKVQILYEDRGARPRRNRANGGGPS
ncbi:acyltransferase family protein [Desulfoglaeba alkanexedens]|uniref:Acyltransferase n=1 Tax=Desulfoglaeba alkanexedens ALDC TaxID=980445 RepID=A0A4P8L0H8_9BACT|nr:acyltransferase [Desulfoglaeba alkanexedens]QCQ21337.1 acyltransferase [Desulfoglaeba alkanexedens ALDC]